MRRALGLTALLLATLLSGCFWLDGHCGPYYEDATWSQPGLYQAMADQGIAAQGPDGGFPLTHPDVEAWGPDARVEVVRFTYGGSPSHSRDRQVALHAAETRPNGQEVPAHVLVQGEEHWGDDNWRTAVTDLLDATGAEPAGGDDLDAWLDAMLADRDEFAISYSGNESTRILRSAGDVTGGNLSALAARLGPSEVVGQIDVGTRTLRWVEPNGTWTFTVALPVRAFDAGELGGIKVLVRADPSDQVSANVPQEMGGDPEAYRAALADRMAAAGLPRPAYTGFDMMVSIC